MTHNKSTRPTTRDNNKVSDTDSFWRDELSQYCKTPIFCVTIFSRGYRPEYIHVTLFSRFSISLTTVHELENIGEDFIFTSLSLHISITS